MPQRLCSSQLVWTFINLVIRSGYDLFEKHDGSLFPAYPCSLLGITIYFHLDLKVADSISDKVLNFLDK